MAEIEIIGVDFSNWVRAARIACEEKGVPYRLVQMKIASPADLKTPAHLALHPFGRIPVMRHGDFTLFETAAIARYVDDTFEGRALVPGERREAALMEQWVSACIDYLARPIMGRFVVQYVLTRLMGGQPDRAVIDAAIPEIRTLLGVVDGALGKGPYLHGATPYIDDFILVCMLSAMTVTPEGPGLLDEAPKVKRLLNAFSERPSFAATLPDLYAQAA
ncbi:MAG: glutathione S-transferase family protein [Pseudomonadota bacterium]|nr:glutathione S-transferase family protein [Pseudomonadota bacterium]